MDQKDNDNRNDTGAWLDWLLKIVFIGVILFVIFYLISMPWVVYGQKGPLWTPWGEAISKIFVPALSAFGTIVGVIVTALITLSKVRQQSTDNTKTRIAADQFKNAIDHLGSQEQTIVLGGVHALHNLAETFPKEYSKQVFEVLCSFIREKTTQKAYQDKFSETLDPSDKTQTTSLIVIQTIVDKLFREDESRKFYQEYKANLSGAFLRRVRFRGANLHKAILWDADFQWVDLSEAKLPGGELHRADLRGAYLYDTDLQGAKLFCARLEGAKLRYAKLDRANLENTNMQGAYLRKASIHSVINFEGAYLRGVQSRKEDNSFNFVKTAIDHSDGLKTDLTGITLSDENGNELITEEDKKAWFRQRGANVDDLSPEQVQEIFKDEE